MRGDSLFPRQPVSTTLSHPHLSLCVACYPQVSIHPGGSWPPLIPHPFYFGVDGDFSLTLCPGSPSAATASQAPDCPREMALC